MTLDMPIAATESSPQIVERVLKALEVLAVGPSSPDELALALDVHRRTVTRMLSTMEAAGYVQRDPATPNRFQLSYKILTLAGMLLKRNDLVRVAHSHVVRLRDRTGEAAHLSVPVRAKVVHIVHEHSLNRLMVKAEAGDDAPMYCSAVGKAVLAFRPDLLALVTAAGLHRLTAKTITSPRKLEAHLEQIRARGYAVDDEEIEIGTRCIAAPVRNYVGEVIAAIGISGPAVRITTERIGELAAVVVEEAASVSNLLGFNPPEQVEPDGTRPAHVSRPARV